MPKHSWIFLFFFLLLLTGCGSNSRINSRIIRSSFVYADPSLDGNGFDIRAKTMHSDHQNHFIRDFGTTREKDIILPESLDVFYLWDDNTIIANDKNDSCVYIYDLNKQKASVLLDGQTFYYAMRDKGKVTIKNNDEYKSQKALYKFENRQLTYIDSVSPYYGWDSYWDNGTWHVITNNSSGSEDTVLIDGYNNYSIHNEKGIYSESFVEGLRIPRVHYLLFRTYNSVTIDTLVRCKVINRIIPIPHSDYLLLSCILSENEYIQKENELGKARKKYAEENPDVISCFPQPPEGTWKLYNTRTKQFFDTGELTNDVTISANGKKILFIDTEKLYTEYSIRIYSVDELTKPEHLVTQ